MIYLDNAATTFPKPRSVIKDLNFCLKKYCGNPGRSSHKLSVMSSEAIYSARESVASLLSTKAAENVVFTYNATYALNLGIKTMIPSGSHVLTSDIEHNSVIRPLEALKNKGKIEYTCFCSEGNIEENIKKSLKSNTKAIVTTIASNVFGRQISLKTLSKIAAEYNLILIVDASQAIGHEVINLCDTPCDLLCAPGHKALFGIQGCGFAVFKDSTLRESFIEGGSGSDSTNLEMPTLLPERYEAGTLATPAIVSLRSGVEFIKSVGIEAINSRLTSLTLDLRERLSQIKGITVYPAGCGLLSFNLANAPSSYISSELDKHGICTRAGLHCAPSAHKLLGTLEQGAVRLSLSYFNTKGELDQFYRQIKQIAFVL